jgi:flagellar basal-body rod protein FlgF
MYIAYTGARNAERKMEQIANNLANVSSAGYKQDKSVDQGVVPLNFAVGQDQVSISGEAPGAPLLYRSTGAQYVDFSPGQMRATGNPLDAALDGDAFFTVATPGGERLTRAGNFHVDGAGSLVTPSGEKVLGNGGPIRVGDGVLSISRDGQLSVGGAVVDTLKLRKVSDPQRLVKTGNNLFDVPKDLPLLAAGKDVTVNQGFLEESNVAAVQGMTEMIEASRMFEAYTKMMTTISELASKASNDLGRV